MKERRDGLVIKKYILQLTNRINIILLEHFYKLVWLYLFLITTLLDLIDQAIRETEIRPRKGIL
jgi:hypothetical protein